MPTDEEVRAFAQGEMQAISADEVANMNTMQEVEQRLGIGEEPAQNDPPQVEQQPAQEQQPATVENIEVPTPEAVKVAESAETPEALLEKISGGKIKSAEELTAFLEKANTPQEEIDPIAKSFNEALKKGLKPKDWAAQQLVDVDSYSNKDVALEYLMQAKGWDKTKAKTYLDNKYYADEQYEDINDAPREYKVAQIELEDLANEGRKYFNSQKIDLDNYTPNIPIVSELQGQLEQIRQQQEYAKQESQKLAEYIDSSLKGFNKHSFQYSYTDTNAQEATDEVGLTLNEEQVKRGADMLKDPRLLIQALTNGGKDMDVKKLVAKLNLLVDDKLFSETLADTRARSTEDFVKKLKNVSPPSIPTYNPANYNIEDERARIREALGSMPERR